MKSLFEQDKLLHILCCALIAAFISSLPIPYAKYLAALAVIIGGAGKEVYDYFHKENHTPDIKDFYADLIGGVIVLAPQFIQRYFA